MKISGAKPFSGQEAANNNPLKSDKRSKWILFIVIYYAIALI